MRLAIHQPNFLPWTGFFSKMRSVDTFVLLDRVQIPVGRSHAHRARILTPNGEQWLSMPIHRTRSTATTYHDAIIEDSRRWVDKMMRTLVCAYARQPHYDDVLDAIESTLICAPGERLAEVNSQLIDTIAAHLHIRTKLLWQSELLPSTHARGAELVAELIGLTDATTYVSGTGARAYNDEALYAARGCTLEYHEHPPARSILDHAMRHGWVLDA
jgi:hypothetical protein